MDRNVIIARGKAQNLRSLSARRAWIEMHGGAIGIKYLQLSLSARRAWIEMVLGAVHMYIPAVSLSARRAWIEIPAG